MKTKQELLADRTAIDRELKKLEEDEVEYVATTEEGIQKAAELATSSSTSLRYVDGTHDIQFPTADVPGNNVTLNYTVNIDNRSYIDNSVTKNSSIETHLTTGDSAVQALAGLVSKVIGF